MTLIALVLAALPDAHAAAYYFLDAGNRGMARGGAFIAGADDLSAQYYNPAALVRLDRPQLYLNASLVNQAVRFTRSDNYGEDPDRDPDWPTATNEGPPMFIPTFGFATKLGLEDWTFAVGFYPPYAPDMEYDPNGPQRYTLTDSLLWRLNAGPSVAWQPLPWLAVGAGLEWSLVRAEQDLTISLCMDDLSDDLENRCPEDYYSHEQAEKPAEENPTQNDVGIAMKMIDPVTMNWNAGLLVLPTPWLAVGFSYQPPIRVEGKGSIAATFSEDHWLVNEPYSILDGREFQDDDITVTLKMPAIARLGVAVRPTERLEVELAGVWEGWHATEEVRISDVDLVLTHDPDNNLVDEDIVVTDDVVLPAGYRDAWSARLGGEWTFERPYSARAGLFWESSAVPPETQGVTVVDGTKLGGAAGGSARIGRRVSLDAAVLYSRILPRTITDSEIRAIEIPVNVLDVLSSPDGVPPIPINDQGAVVGNGRFEASMLMFSLGATVYFGA